MAKLSEFKKSHQRKIKKEFHKQGVNPSDLKHLDLKVGEGDNRIRATFGYGKRQVTMSIPAPSQYVINETVDKYGGVILGALIAVPIFALGILFERRSRDS